VSSGSQPTDSPPGESTNGASRPGAFTDQHGLNTCDQSLSDADQTGSASDQTLADSDQTSSDSDQTSADTDQLAADRDQAASDRDQGSGAEGQTHALTREMRERTAAQRGLTAGARMDAAALRDTIAHKRDLAAQARDQAAEARDLAITQVDATLRQAAAQHGLVTGAEVVIRADGRRKRAARDRAESAGQRVLAAVDREAAAEDRDQATGERAQALADREALAHELAIAAIDPLTGTMTRAAGLRDLDRELERCRRTKDRLTVAYVDVVGLKAINDSRGHQAGDELLRHVTALIRTHLRPYDLIIRHGGDEFLCAMPNLAVPAARARFALITGAIAHPGTGAISSGFAELRAGDSASDLIARADSELIASRRGNRATRPGAGAGPGPGPGHRSQ
jgi:diguanylate cyclase (GGDEF)-like protein